MPPASKDDYRRSRRSHSRDNHGSMHHVNVQDGDATEPVTKTEERQPTSRNWDSKYGPSSGGSSDDRYASQQVDTTYAMAGPSTLPTARNDANQRGGKMVDDGGSGSGSGGSVQKDEPDVRVSVRPRERPPLFGSSTIRRSSSARSGSLPRLTSYLVDLGDGARVRLKGMNRDLRAITQSVWLTDKTHVQGFMEAAAKLIVYLVAALSGNMKQAGSLLMMALLLANAALLGLSNAHAKGFMMRGRVAEPSEEEDEDEDGDGDGDDGDYDGPGTGRGSGRAAAGGYGGGVWRRRRPARNGKLPYPADGEGDVQFPTTSHSRSSGHSAMDDWAEKGQVGARVVRDGRGRPFMANSVDYN